LDLKEVWFAGVDWIELAQGSVLWYYVEDSALNLASGTGEEFHHQLFHAIVHNYSSLTHAQYSVGKLRH
jgi:hypothetical protein